MEFDRSCKARTSDLQIPTLQPGVKADPCDRTDYSNIQGQAQAQYDLDQYRVASPGVFRVDQSLGRGGNTPRGSAFSLGAFGDTCLLASDYHVPKGSDGLALPGLTLQASDGSRTSTQVRSWDKEHDLSILATPLSAIKSCPALPLAQTARNLNIGTDRIVAVGHPAGSKLQFISGGEVENKDRTHADIDPKGKVNPWANGKTVEVKGQIIGGMSGAPAMADGKVYGAIQGLQGNARMIITPVDDLQTLLHNTLAASVKNGIPCDFNQAKAEAIQRVAAGELLSSFSTSRSATPTIHYSFNFGQELTLDQKNQTCTWSATSLGATSLGNLESYDATTYPDQKSLEKNLSSDKK